jgi:hypothetical protein
MSTRTCRIGIHGRNRPEFEERDFILIREMRAEVVKMMTRPNETKPGVFERLKNENPGIEIITRLDHSDINKGGHPPAERYANELKPTIQALLPYCRKFQITNEPNHIERYEGWGKEDADAKDYNGWFIEVYRRLKDAFPEASFGFPGLAMPDFLHRDRSWLNICREAVNEADWLGVHCYWQTPPQKESMKFNPDFGLSFKYYHQQFPNKTLEILECGNSNSQTQGFHISEEAIAQEYVDWLQELFNYPYIGSASFFIISSPDNQWDGFRWRHEDGRFKPMVARAAQMARPNLVSPTAQPAQPAQPVQPAQPAQPQPPQVSPPAAAGNYTNQHIIDAFKTAAIRLGLGNWDLMSKAGLSLGKLAQNRPALYNGPKLADLPRLTPAEKQKIREALPVLDAVAGQGVSFATATRSLAAMDFLKNRPELFTAPLAFPRAEQLKTALAQGGLERAALKTWNRYGWLLLLIAEALQLEPGLAVAVVAAQVKGRGAGPDGRLLIRFEPQSFFERWGRENEAQFRQYFGFDPDQPWQRHQWRPGSKAAWQKLHTNQASEWAAFELACSLDEAAAKAAVLMGATQLPGFLHALLGYESSADMFTAFASQEQYHLLGLFDLFAGPEASPRSLAALQAGDFETFAALQHGADGAARYGSAMRRAFELFQRLKPV